MRSTFPSHFANDPNRIKALWADCLFVVDTNVLTGMYKYSDETRDALYNVIESLGDRLWVPYQVMYEFLDNRAKIVHDQSKLYSAAISKLESLKDDFEASTKHPFVSAPTYEKFCRSSEELIRELEAGKKFHEQRITNDDVKGRLALLLEGKVGHGYSKETLAELVKEGEARYSQSIPPGFEDSNKHKGTTLLKEIHKRYGDLIFWKQILDKAKELSVSVILVTGEKKPDWWSICGGKTIGPLPELLDEFSGFTGKEFYIYATHNFLTLANEYLEQKTSSAAVEEIRDTATADAELLKHSLGLMGELVFECDEGSFECFDVEVADSKYFEAMLGRAAEQMMVLEGQISKVRELIANIEPGRSPVKLNLYERQHKSMVRRRAVLHQQMRVLNDRFMNQLRDELI
ncbi:DUF4935 domain-containing protein [Pseudomonas sp. WS 5021]|uniref:PIN-like domain-containing protein n=1 Tax=Pseudomonas sp. WS 5021 TaxID=2717490 RepID=UPI001472D4C3|nr:PIN-like domain-containing protein [Pseudomonas sp. WS 5021]NMY24772.1 DUF4935 domain-containing protein [Pseudomonas sp. WS 5021]